MNVFDVFVPISVFTIFEGRQKLLETDGSDSEKTSIAYSSFVGNVT